MNIEIIPFDEKYAKDFLRIKCLLATTVFLY